MAEMNEQQIIDWAREAKAARDGSLFLLYLEDLQRFAYLVAANERERCASLVEPSINHRENPCDYLGNSEGVELLSGLAEAIRSLKD
jgi:hypothetical protein